MTAGNAPRIALGGFALPEHPKPAQRQSSALWRARNRLCRSSSISLARSAFSGSAFAARSAICASSLARRASSVGVRWSGMAGLPAEVSEGGKSIAKAGNVLSVAQKVNGASAFLRPSVFACRLVHTNFDVEALFGGVLTKNRGNVGFGLGHIVSPLLMPPYITLQSVTQTKKRVTAKLFSSHLTSKEQDA